MAGLKGSAGSSGLEPPCPGTLFGHLCTLYDRMQPPSLFPGALSTSSLPSFCLSSIPLWHTCQAQRTVDWRQPHCKLLCALCCRHTDSQLFQHASCPSPLASAPLTSPSPLAVLARAPLLCPGPALGPAPLAHPFPLLTAISPALLARALARMPLPPATCLRLGAAASLLSIPLGHHSTFVMHGTYSVTYQITRLQTNGNKAMGLMVL